MTDRPKPSSWLSGKNESAEGQAPVDTIPFLARQSSNVCSTLPSRSPAQTYKGLCTQVFEYV